MPCSTEGAVCCRAAVSPEPPLVRYRLTELSSKTEHFPYYVPVEVTPDNEASHLMRLASGVMPSKGRF